MEYWSLFRSANPGNAKCNGRSFAQYALSSEKLYRDIVTDNAMITDLPSGNWRLSRWWWY